MDLFFLSFGLFQYFQGFFQIADVFFHVVYVVSTANQFQVGDSGFLEAVEGAKAASGLTAEVAIFVATIALFRIIFTLICTILARFTVAAVLSSAVSALFATILLSLPGASFSKAIGYPAQIAHLITVKGIAKSSGKLA